MAPHSGKFVARRSAALAWRYLMKLRLPLLALAGLTLAGCAYDYSAPSEVVNGVAVYTHPIGSPTFTYGTYTLDTTVTHRDNGDPVADVAMPAAVQAAIRAQMTALGYTEAATVAEAQVGLQMGLATGDVAVFYSGGWCDYYYYWYGCYYPPVYAGSYQVGFALLGMVDLTSPPAGGIATPFPPLWSASMYGVTNGFPTDVNRMVEAVNRAFTQSPYLQAAAD